MDTQVSTGTSLRNVGTSQGVPGLNKLAKVGKSSDTGYHHHHPAESRPIQPDLMTTTINKKSELQGNVDTHYSDKNRVNNSVRELASIFGNKRSSGRQPGENTGKKETFGRQPQEEDIIRLKVNVFKPDENGKVKFGNDSGRVDKSSDQEISTIGRQQVFLKNRE